MASKVRIASLLKMKQDAKPLVMVTAYDFPTGALADESEVDIILVGDSLGTCVLGLDSEIKVRMDMMVHHTAAVRCGVKNALLVGDMPFMSYHESEELALRNAARLMQEGGAEAVKLEGGRHVIDKVTRIVNSGIPVMGHIGLTPQSVHALSGHRIQGRDVANAKRLMEDAHMLQDAGCFAIVLECVTREVADEISQSLTVPTIGIGSGEKCDGQVLVMTDLIGLTQRKTPSFVKQYAHVSRQIKRAIRAYAADVREGKYPDREHSFSTDNKNKLDPKELRDFVKTIAPIPEETKGNE
ncbi:MAG: 3-methyl-2-oxobutanoate hydroxymethyltransferase [Candidatus Sumerlaeia bacterium]